MGHVMKKAWVVYDMHQLNRLFNEHREILTDRRSTAAVEHFNTNYAEADGVKSLGFEFLQSSVYMLHNSETGSSTFELRVECREGLISRSEALGEDWVPSPSEIVQRAAEIRRKNDELGIIREHSLMY